MHVLTVVSPGQHGMNLDGFPTCVEWMTPASQPRSLVDVGLRLWSVCASIPANLPGLSPHPAERL